MSHTDTPLVIPSYSLPASAFLSDKTRQAMDEHQQSMQAYSRALTAAGLLQPVEQTTAAIAAMRQQKADLFYQTPSYKTLRTQYDVVIKKSDCVGVTIETFTPAEGLSPASESRVLINLFGGNFEAGSGIASHLESIPLAALGRIKVVSVDYRMAPEHRFPAATDDVIAVYAELLKDYPAQQIGFVGSSAGARLASQVLVQLQTTGMPPPGAVAMIAWSAADRQGDSMAMVAPVLMASSGYDLKAATIDYLEHTDVNDPAVTPAVNDAAMAQFPPTMLASSSRDWLLSSVTACHRQLCRLGVTTELHIWDGLDHYFHANPLLPETKELHQTTVQFFNHYLEKNTA